MVEKGPACRKQRGVRGKGQGTGQQLKSASLEHGAAIVVLGYKQLLSDACFQ
jgi:hypothetical protein